MSAREAVLFDGQFGATERANPNAHAHRPPWLPRATRLFAFAPRADANATSKTWPWRVLEHRNGVCALLWPASGAPVRLCATPAGARQRKKGGETLARGQPLAILGSRRLVSPFSGELRDRNRTLVHSGSNVDDVDDSKDGKDVDGVNDNKTDNNSKIDNDNNNNDNNNNDNNNNDGYNYDGGGVTWLVLLVPRAAELPSRNQDRWRELSDAELISPELLRLDWNQQEPDNPDNDNVDDEQKAKRSKTDVDQS